MMGLFFLPNFSASKTGPGTRKRGQETRRKGHVATKRGQETSKKGLETRRKSLVATKRTLGTSKRGQGIQYHFCENFKNKLNKNRNNIR